jgi:hypothetical protein
MFPEAIAVTVMGLTALTLFRIFQEKNANLARRKVSVTLNEPGEVIPALYAKLAEAGAKPSEFDFEQSLESVSARISFETDIPIRLGLPAYLRLVRQCPGVLAVKVSRL